MTDAAADAARSAAAILAPDLGPGLPAEVEAALAARGTGQRPDRYLDPVPLASLIVAIADLAWTIYNDRRKQPPRPAAGLDRPPGPHHPARPGHGPAPWHRADHRSGRHRDHPPGQPARVARPRGVSLRCYPLRRHRSPPDRPAGSFVLSPPCVVLVQRLRADYAAAAQATVRGLRTRRIKTVTITLWPWPSPSGSWPRRARCRGQPPPG